MTTVMTTKKTSENARRIRRAVLFVVSLLAVAVAWELYKAVGPEAGGKSHSRNRRANLGEKLSNEK